MPICKVFLNNTYQAPIKVSVNRELERGVDTAEVTFPGNVVPHENDDIKILFDQLDLTGLIGIYHLENNAKDESGGMHDGTVSGGTYVASKYGMGWNTVTDGSSNYIQIPNHADFNFGASGTHAIVFHMNLAAASTNRTIICKGDNSNFDDRCPLIYLKVSGGQYAIGYRKSIGASSQDSLDAALGTISLNTDYVVVCQFSPTIGMEIWVNGTRIAQNLAGTNAMITTTENLRIGTLVGANGPVGAPKATFGYVKFYNRTLSQLEIQQLSNQVYISTNLKFGGKIWQIDDKVTPRKCQCKSYGKVVGETTVQPKVYNNTTVNTIIQDLVTTNTSLTFLLGASYNGDAGVNQFVAQGNLFDILVSLASMLDKTFYTDALGQFHLDDNEALVINKTFTNGTNCTMRESGMDDTQLVNDVTIQGRDQLYRKQDYFVGDGVTTVYNTSYIITTPYIQVGGTAKVADIDYTIDTQNRTVTFVTPPAGGKAVDIQYTYDSPVTIHSSDATSISTYGKRSKIITAPWITTLADATKYAFLYLAAFKDVTPRYQVRIPWLEVQIDTNLIVKLVNSIKGINGNFTIKSITWEYPGITVIQCGEFNLNQFEIHKQIVQELHSLQQLSNTNTTLVNYRNVNEPITMTDSSTKHQLGLAYYNSASYYSNYQVYSE